MQERFYSRIDRLRIEGGYLDGLTADFSGHLNTVIGGRGAGILEGGREAFTQRREKYGFD